MTKDLLIKYLDNKCTDAEIKEVLQWAKTEALTEEGKKLGLDDWNHYQEEEILIDNDKYTALFDRIQDEIENRESAKQQSKTGNLSLITKWLTRAAAILLIPVLAFLFYTLSEKKSVNNQLAVAAVDSMEIIAPIGSRTVVQLSDGSVVHLNYGSRIKYPKYFKGGTREIMLIGEGYFNVTSDPDKPFIVKTAKLNVKALGTAFNVLAYPGDDIIETTLVRGKVVLEQNEEDGNTNVIGAMEPGQHAAYNLKTGDISSTKGSVEKYIAWKDGRLVFEDTPITEIAEKLNHMFNVNIKVDKEIEDYIYTFTLVDEPLSQILDLMTIATPVKYKMFQRKKLTDGTYSKQKIIIEKK